MKLYKILPIIAFFILQSLVAKSQKKSIDQRVDSLIHLMTLEEKVGQLNQYSGAQATGPVTPRQSYMLNDIRSGRVGSMLNVKGVKDTREIQAQALKSRLKIPLLFGLDVIHGFKTVFPIPLAEAASWDLEAIKMSAHIAAKEAAAAGIHWTFAPMVDICRDPRWGRIMEGAGEDPYLASMIAKARVLGFQGEKLGKIDEVMACAKHFAAYGAVTAGRDYNSVDMSKQQLWQIYLPPFKAAVEAGVATFMNSFSTLNGIPATGNCYLQRDILKKQWDFSGFVVSDWGSIGQMIQWGYAKDKCDAAFKAITAGCDMDMESESYKWNLVKLVKDGKICESLVDEAVRRILYKKFELGLFEDPYKFSNEEREKEVLSDSSHRSFAREIAQKSIVLLKNENNILPLKKLTSKIALIGPLGKARRDLLGEWVVKADESSVTSLYDVLLQKVGKDRVSYVKGCDFSSVSHKGFAEALNIAKQSDIIIMTLGENCSMSGESRSMANINLPEVQEDLFEEIKATGKPVIVVLMAGRPLIFNKIADNASGIIYAWQLGSEAGNAIADVLYGDYNPSGKLPVTFPRSMGQIPLSYDYYNTGKPVKDPNQLSIRYTSAYIDVPNAPRYSFGFGLSYSNFNYSDLKLSANKINGKEKIDVSFKLSNTGKVSGEEIVQLYIQDVEASIVRPVKALKDFKKIKLDSEKSTIIHFTIDKEKLSFYNDSLQWTAEPGEFKVMIGAASDNILLNQSFELLR